MLKISSLFLLVVAFPAIASVNFGAPSGKLVTRFGTNGSALLQIPPRNVVIYDSVVDSQQRIIVVGGPYGVVARFLPTGQLDTSFNGVGYKDLDTNANTFAWSVALLNDTIYVGCYGSGIPCFVASLTESGSLNPQWGTNGIYSIVLNPNDLAGMTLQSDGKVLVCGSLDGTNGYLLRINATGTGLDTTFNATGTPGYQTFLNVPDVYMCLVSSTGDIRVVASTGINSAVYAFTAAGALDTSYNSTGVSQVLTNKVAFAMFAQSQGQLVLVGETAGGGPIQVFALRLTSAGRLDTTFGTNGTVSTGITGSALGGMLTLNDYFFVGCMTGANEALAIAYDNNGTLVPTFGNAGVATLGNSMQAAYSINSARNSMIVIAGYTPNDGILQELTSYQLSQVGVSGPSVGVSSAGTNSFTVAPTTVYSVPVATPELLPQVTKETLSGL